MARHDFAPHTVTVYEGAVAPEQTPQCMMLADPGADPAIGGDNSNLGGDDMFDVNVGYSDEALRAKIFHDLIHMAFVCDLTRSVALLYTMAQSHMNIHPIVGHPFDQHELGHSGLGTTEVSRSSPGTSTCSRRWSPRSATPPRAPAACSTAARWSCCTRAATATTENMACMIAGRAGGLKGGQHLVATGMHPGNVLNTAMRAGGVDQDLGEVVGVVPGLLA